MLASVIDVAVAVLLGSFTALLYKRRYRKSSESWYLGVTLLVVLGLWTNALAANLLSVGYWGIEVPTVRISSTIWIIYLLSYPLWFRAAGELTFIIAGRQPDQGGIIWVFRLADRTAPISPTWNSTEVTVDTEIDSSGDSTEE